MSTGNTMDLNELAVKNFREYLKIPSVHPNVDYDDCLKFLRKQAEDLNLSFKIYHVVPKKPIIILTWIGQDDKLSTIMLNSHMDVVPVFEDKWTYKPFEAFKDPENRIYGRGTQDMKSVGVQYLEAIRRVKLAGKTFQRTIHVSFVPDEEIGGVDGMRQFVHTQHFRDLNVGVSLDEGMASPTEVYPLYYGERAIWHFHLHCTGQSGHGSQFLVNTPGEKVLYLLNKFYEFRRQEKKKLDDNPDLTLGDVTTINLTQIKGGVQSNVVPPEMTIVVDCRLAVTVDFDEWELQVKRWCEEAGGGVRIEYEQKQPKVTPTKLDDSNKFWVAFKKAADELGLKLKPQIFPGGTDSRYVRSVGIPAIGFSPMNHTPVLLHDNDEYLTVDTFLKGIDIYCKIIPELANVKI